MDRVKHSSETPKPATSSRASEEKNPQRSHIFAIVAILLGLAFVVILLIILLRGETTVSGTYPDDIVDVSLSCNNKGLDYPLFSYDHSTGKETRISAVFRNNNIDSVSLIHILYYPDLNASIGSEAFNHGAINGSCSSDGFSSDCFSATYSKSDTRMQLTLFARSADLAKPAALKYFLIDRDVSLSSPEEYKAMFEKKGFICSLSD